ncbi:glucosidase 2 subunit beta-like isoform X2 [Lineus longissimus]|uniref:glucosidase 2 subunit beta-like isoform X2 n=1 Tax=Lineus longissimus TaxID=88925 RepID=UPI00315D2EC0
MVMKTITILVFLLTCSQKNADAVNRPRGVEISKMSFYAGEKFTCLDGSATLSMDWVNDDYCDCRDGSDEPGTSACPNGQFNCKNVGFKSFYIPSSRVNDGICDCCDGSDEFSGLTLCENTCDEMGRASREEEERNRLLLTEGFKVFEEYSKQGNTAQDEARNNIETLEKERMELESKLEEVKKAKEEAETPEIEAKEKHRKAWDDLKAEREAELEKIRASTAFQEIDTNGDSLVSLDEMKTHLEFDISGDGVVNEEEAKEYLEENDQVDMTTFQEKVWPSIKQIYQKPGSKESEENVEVKTPPPETTHIPTGPFDVPPADHEKRDDYHDDDDDDEDDFDHPDTHPEMKEEKEEEKPTPDEERPEDQMPDYDEATKALIEAADKARSDYDEVNNRVDEIKRELEGIEKLLKSDFGPKNQFYPLKGQCFEYTDREYIYKLCPYDRTSQRSKNGGGETSLGSWGEWAGPENDKYIKQKYTGGQNCWNGPDRSVVVSFHCGLVNEVVSASEPNRCEYAFDFNTPASCDKVAQPEQKDPAHDEL